MKQLRSTEMSPEVPLATFCRVVPEMINAYGHCPYSLKGIEDFDLIAAHVQKCNDCLMSVLHAEQVKKLQH